LKVSVEEVKFLLSRLAEINSVPLESIIWTSYGKDLEVPAHRIDDWKFVGMSNVYFIETDAYANDWQIDDLQK
jgi:hypothetical protein